MEDSSQLELRLVEETLDAEMIGEAYIDLKEELSNYHFTTEGFEVVSLHDIFAKYDERILVNGSPCRNIIATINKLIKERNEALADKERYKSYLDRNERYQEEGWLAFDRMEKKLGKIQRAKSELAFVSARYRDGAAFMADMAENFMHAVRRHFANDCEKMPEAIKSTYEDLGEACQSFYNREGQLHELEQDINEALD